MSAHWPPASAASMQAFRSQVGDSVVHSYPADPGEDSSTDLYLSSDGHVTMRNLMVRLRSAAVYGNNPNYPYPAGAPWVRVSDRGNLFAGENPWVTEDGNGKIVQMNRTRTGGTSDSPFSPDFAIDNRVNTVFGGRRFFFGDTDDPVDAVLQRADSPQATVASGSLGSPIVVGCVPVNVPMVTLGTSAALSAWGTRGKTDMQRHAPLPFDPANKAFEKTQDNRATYTGLDFTPGAHKLVGVVGGVYTVLQAVTLNTTTPTDVIVAVPDFRTRATQGEQQVPGTNARFTRTGYGGTTFAGQPAGKLVGCKARSGTISLAAGDTFNQYFQFGAGATFRASIAPNPPLAAPGELPHWWTNSVGGLGRYAWRGPAIPPGGVPGNDAATQWSAYVASIGAEATEDAFTNAASGRLKFSTNPYGGTGEITRAYIEALGQVNALAGVAFGPAVELAKGTNNLNPTPYLGQSGQYAYTDVGQAEAHILVGAALTVTVTTTTAGDSTHNEVQQIDIAGGVAGDQYTLTLNGEETDAIAYDTDLSADNNEAAALTVRLALEALPSIDPNDLVVTRTIVSGTTQRFTVTFGVTLTASHSRYKITNTAPTLVTNLLITSAAVIDGQLLILRAMNTNTTLRHNVAGPGKIWLKDAADRALLQNETIFLMYDDPSATFYEVASKPRLAGLTPNRALITDSTGAAVVSPTVTDTQLGYLGGATPVTSSVQAQLNALGGGGGGGIPAPASPADDVLQYKSGAWTNRTIAQLALDLLSASTLQPYDNELTALALTTAAANTIPYFSGTNTALTTAFTAGGRALVGLAGAADKIPYFTRSSAAAIADFPAAMRTFLTTSSSANLAALLTDETGRGAAVFATSPTLVTPALGTPASGTLTNATGLPLAGLTGGANDDIVQRKAGAWTNRTLAQPAHRPQPRRPVPAARR